LPGPWLCTGDTLHAIGGGTLGAGALGARKPSANTGVSPRSGGGARTSSLSARSSSVGLGGGAVDLAGAVLKRVSGLGGKDTGSGAGGLGRGKARGRHERPRWPDQ
jgi:hypothetical protein